MINIKEVVKIISFIEKKFGVPSYNPGENWNAWRERYSIPINKPIPSNILPNVPSGVSNISFWNNTQKELRIGYTQGNQGTTLKVYSYTFKDLKYYMQLGQKDKFLRIFGNNGINHCVWYERDLFAKFLIKDIDSVLLEDEKLKVKLKTYGQIIYNITNLESGVWDKGNNNPFGSDKGHLILPLLSKYVEKYASKNKRLVNDIILKTSIKKDLDNFKPGRYWMSHDAEISNKEIEKGFRSLGNWVNDYQDGQSDYEDNDQRVWAKGEYKKYLDIFKTWAKTKPWYKKVELGLHTGEKDWCYFTITIK